MNREYSSIGIMDATFWLVMNWDDLAPEHRIVIVVGAPTLREAEMFVESCENCNSDGAEIPFDWILDRVTASDPATTDYVIEMPAKCPNCRRPVKELLSIALDD